MRTQKSVKDMTVKDFLDNYPEAVLLKWLRAGLRSSERKRKRSAQPLSKSEQANKLLQAATSKQIEKIFQILVCPTKR